MKIEFDTDNLDDLKDRYVDVYKKIVYFRIKVVLFAFIIAFAIAFLVVYVVVPHA